MAWLAWFREEWFTLLQTIGIVGSLVFTGIAMRTDAKARRLHNLLTITAGHRAIWSEVFSKPKLGRILDPKPDLDARPITREEELFVTTIVLHLGSAHRAIEDGLLDRIEGIEADIRHFFGLPIPLAVWDRLKHKQEITLVGLVERITAATDSNGDEPGATKVASET